MSSLNSAPITIRFFPPDDKLKPYISTLYLTEVVTDDSERIADYLHPEWTNLRFFDGNCPLAAIGDDEPELSTRFAVVGPTSRATYFSAATMRAWGIGLLPLGWAKLVGAPADKYADIIVDGLSAPDFLAFAPFQNRIFASSGADAKTEAATINQLLVEMLKRAPDDDLLVQRAHGILVDPDLATVQEMAERLSITGRTLDRLSRRAFGFAPKLLLRRQRFLRSLADNMLDPAKNWVSTLDYQYYDQAHFGRDFRNFMGMSASEYKALPHPFMNAAVHGRMAAAGAGMQALHRPEADD